MGLVPSREKRDLPHPGPASLHLPGDRAVLLLLHVPRPHPPGQCPAAPAVFPLRPSLRSGPLPPSAQVSPAQGLGELLCSSLALSSPSQWRGVATGLGSHRKILPSALQKLWPLRQPIFPQGQGCPRWAWQARQRHSVAGSKLLRPCSLRTDLCALWLTLDVSFSLTERCRGAQASQGPCRLS